MNFKYIYSILTGTAILLMTFPSHAQRLNQPFYDIEKKVHFGFTFGLNHSTFKYQLSPLFYQTDTVMRVNMKSYPGLHLGGVFNYHLGNHFDLRVIPTLILSQRAVEYTLNTGIANGSEHPDGNKDLKEIESVFIEFPLLAKFKSERLTNLRFYVIGGGKYAYDMSSDYAAARDPNDPFFAIFPHNFYYEYGVGLDVYFPYFKFSPELKFSKGINNILVPDHSFHTTIFQRFQSQFILFSLYFE
jgi:hypothetical protein